MLVAKTLDGMRYSQVIEVKNISTWIGKTCNHPVNSESLASLLQDASKSKQMQIYDNGHIDAFGDCPLYTNGQKTVISLYLDNVLIWEK